MFCLFLRKAQPHAAPRTFLMKKGGHFFFFLFVFYNWCPNETASGVVSHEKCFVGARISVSHRKLCVTVPLCSFAKASHRIRGMISPTPVVVSSTRSSWTLTVIPISWKIPSTATSAQTGEVSIGRRAVPSPLRRNRKPQTQTLGSLFSEFMSCFFFCFFHTLRVIKN